MRRAWFRVLRLVVVPVVLLAAAGGAFAAERVRIEPLFEPPDQLETVMQGGTAIRYLRVTDAKGKPIADAAIHFSDKRAAVKTNADGEAAVEVKTAGVKRYSVLVSPDMLDLSKEIEVHTNGQTSFAGTVEADARVILEEARRFKDRKLLFVNRVTVDVE